MPQWKFIKTKRADQPASPAPSRLSSAELRSSFYNRIRNLGSVTTIGNNSSHITAQESSTCNIVSGEQGQILPSPAPSSTQDRRDDPLGLTILHTPETGKRVVDILFIHGLGGTSLRTWCKNRELEYLWPQKWLSQETDFAPARILTFGYNANFSARKQQCVLGINDFAADLLYCMKYSFSEVGDKMGEVPIVIVAHSMGGLVTKKAFIHGHSNQEYQQLVSNIKSIVFLATPHRGTSLAKTLNRILSSSVFGHTPKDYVNELARNSLALDEINDTFRHHASKLRLFSFYETLGTQIGLMNVMILEKQSALLGYENETTKPLNANHHDVCKFTSSDDPNYRSIRDALRSVVSTFRPSAAHNDDVQEELAALHLWLGLEDTQDDDVPALLSIRKDGTCEGLGKTPEFENWLTSDYSHVLWAHAPPGYGKSVQCSFVIDSLKRHYKCVHWFFRSADARKHLIANQFRSVAYQIAIQDAVFRRSLTEQAKGGNQIINSDAATAWQALFAPRLSLIDYDLFWIIDALDESESSRTIVDLISNIGVSERKIHVLCFSRPLTSISQSFKKARKRVRVTEISLRHNLSDIRLAAADELEEFPADEEFKQSVAQEIAERSHGNFLWTTMVLKRIMDCFRPEDVWKVLEDLPGGMDKLYNRMADSVCKIDVEANRQLSRILISWATHSIRPITVDELKSEYVRELSTVLDLNHLITQICGEFAIINQNDQLTLVHQTARDYLRATDRLGFTLEPSKANEGLLGVCLKSLGDLTPNKILQGNIASFISYSSVFWSAHLDLCSADSEVVLEALFRFFSSNLPVSWIQVLAINSQTSTLVKASTSLTSFVRRAYSLNDNETSTQRVSELNLLERWATDLLQITTKFGGYLNTCPEIIHTCIPPLSPESSIIHRKFSKYPAVTLSISGVSNTDWDDCLARFGMGAGRSKYFAISGRFLAVANEWQIGKATISLFDSLTFQERRKFFLDEPLSAISISQTGSLLACCGLLNTTIWNVSDGSTVCKLESWKRDRAVTVQFAPDNSSVLVATKLRQVYRLDIKKEHPSWTLYDTRNLDDTFFSLPSSLAFDEDCTQLAIGYRGLPLTIWNLSPPKVVARCNRKPIANNEWTSVKALAWHPFNGQVLSVYADGAVSKWDPNDDTYEETKDVPDTMPAEIRCSRSGAVFATSTIGGIIEIYNYSRMEPIHRLVASDMTFSIAFSPDSLRLYDLRESHCNVWQPDCLLRMAEIGLSEDAEHDDNSDSNGTAPLFSGVKLPQSQFAEQLAITAAANCRGNQHICAYVKDDYIVEVYDLRRDVQHTIERCETRTGIFNVALSQKGDHIAYTMHQNIVHVKSLDLASTCDEIKIGLKCSVERSFGGGHIFQLLFDGGCERILVCGRVGLEIIRITDGKVIAEKGFTSDDKPSRWESHPTDPDTLLAFTTGQVKAYSWETMEPITTIPVEINKDAHDRNIGNLWEMEYLAPSYNSRMRLAVTSYKESHSKHSSFLVLDTSVLCRSASPQTTICTVEIPQTIVDHIDRPLGILEDGRLVFVDKDLWVCTARLKPPSSSRLKRHFFLPRDWLTSAGLLLCQVQADGTLLCPRRGEMAVVRSGLGMGW
ncbi:hypothetical protein F4808DRAFT_411405 [Astrocystis sublimbata]|nr:hypothetical protein F4808DRAFT_411405 [Astrocystis sublimbata]